MSGSTEYEDNVSRRNNPSISEAKGQRLRDLQQLSMLLDDDPQRATELASKLGFSGDVSLHQELSEAIAGLVTPEIGSKKILGKEEDEPAEKVGSSLSHAEIGSLIRKLDDRGSPDDKNLVQRIYRYQQQLRTPSYLNRLREQDPILYALVLIEAFEMGITDIVEVPGLSVQDIRRMPGKGRSPAFVRARALRIVEHQGRNLVLDVSIKKSEGTSKARFNSGAALKRCFITVRITDIPLDQDLVFYICMPQITRERLPDEFPFFANFSLKESYSFSPHALIAHHDEVLKSLRETGESKYQDEELSSETYSRLKEYDHGMKGIPFFCCKTGDGFLESLRQLGLLRQLELFESTGDFVKLLDDSDHKIPIEAAMEGDMFRITGKFISISQSPGAHSAGFRGGSRRNK